jgi:polar amino acid transport system permease protein
MDGLKTTILLFIIVIICSLPLAFIITLLVRSRFKPVRYIFSAFIYIIRGTPLLLQLLFIFLGLPNIPVIGEYLTFGRFTAAVIGFTLNYSAYFAEIFRGGLLAVDKGQYEAAQVLGLNKIQTTIRVVLPQMIRVALPAITNESITLVKDTSLLYAVSVPDLLHYTKVSVSRTADPSIFLISAIIYLVMNTLLTFLFKKLEKKLEF